MGAMRQLSFFSILLALSIGSASCVGHSVVPTRFDGGSDAGASPDTGGGGADAGPTDAGSVDAGPAPTVTIFQIQDPSAAGHVAVGASVRITGAIVAAVDAFEENGAGMGNLSDVWIADPAGGPFSGVHVYMPAHATCAGHPMLGVGDTVDATGTVQEFAVPSDGSGRTVTQLIGGTVTCTTAATGAGPTPIAVPDAATLTTDATAEAFEGVLVEISGVEATADPDRFGTEALRIGPPIDDDLYAHPGSRRDRFTTLRGVLHYMFGRWEILPRAATDIVLGAPRTTEDESGAWGCGDAEDSDGDGAIDCADADCAGSLFCRGDAVTVEDVQDTTRAAHPPADADVALVGPLVVTSIDTLAEMTGAGYTGTVVVQDPDATDPRHAGIHVFVPMIEPCGAALALGDRVYVAGRYEEYAEAGDTGTLTEITGGIVSCRMPGAPLAPTAIAVATDLGAATTAEPWEGVLVEIAAVDVTMPAGTYGRFQVAGSVYVDDDVYRTTVTLGDHLARVAGVLTYQFEYQLEPRMAEDVVIGPTEHDDASCGNGTDDDGDGAADCSDLDCCGTAPCGGAVAGRRLLLSEVVYDASGADDTHEWIELRNAGTSAVPLACYALGSGPTSYRYSLAQLPPIVVPAGGCVLIGGPDCGGGACTADLDFEPDFHNGTAGSASGVALLYAMASAVTDATVPVDAVLYGTANMGMLRDASGAIPAMASVADVTAGHSIARAADGSWMDLASPTPGTCTTFTPP
jgi:hypothetical protein